MKADICCATRISMGDRDGHKTSEMYILKVCNRSTERATNMIRRNTLICNRLIECSTTMSRHFQTAEGGSVILRRVQSFENGAAEGPWSYEFDGRTMKLTRKSITEQAQNLS